MNVPELFIKYLFQKCINSGHILLQGKICNGSVEDKGDNVYEMVTKPKITLDEPDDKVVGQNKEKKNC